MVVVAGLLLVSTGIVISVLVVVVVASSYILVAVAVVDVVRHAIDRHDFVQSLLRHGTAVAHHLRLVAIPNTFLNHYHHRRTAAVVPVVVGLLMLLLLLRRRTTPFRVQFLVRIGGCLLHDAVHHQGIL